ncbi:lysophospholipid acyltransferase family protein [Yinghuangia soli]|uniref:1-acyl-sn-glycerol-3-phosphate acyltransferase n=1 Tax=Yinghuangia soli TaxID=2908204 RepID=A0AA41QBE3_9ACTN|nr:lysophospholipid acyltransferase family protein [Yinghuangia soli]MCF2533799.1 1-acyl-sn-glycerol-3-phosphate acyltransferase [Yinghuangia soli]
MVGTAGIETGNGLGAGRRTDLRTGLRARTGVRRTSGPHTLRRGPASGHRALAGRRHGLDSGIGIGANPDATSPAPLAAPRTGTKLGARLRRRLWRTVLGLGGNVTVVGELPPGGCVVVANHASHADTPALLATLDAAHAPRVAAAADYWFTKRLRRAVCLRLAAGFPVRRAGGGSADLAAMEPALRAGHAVVIYPEGTRGDGSEVADFRGGALRLAATAGVPVVPVGIAGTAQLMPKHGKPRPARVRVHIGAPLTAPTPDQARFAVAELAMDAYAARRAALGTSDTKSVTDADSTGTDSTGTDNAADAEKDSRLRIVIARIAASPRIWLLAAAWAFAEALSWPLMPELLLAMVCVAAPSRGIRLVPFVTAGTVAGGVLAMQLSLLGATPPAPWTTDRMRGAARTQLAQEGASAVAHQPWNGIPYKVYAAEAGRVGDASTESPGHAAIGPAEWAWETTKARAVRNWVVAGVFTAFGVLTLRLRRWYGVYLGGLAVCFATGLWLIVQGWQ